MKKKFIIFFGMIIIKCHSMESDGNNAQISFYNAGLEAGGQLRQMLECAYAKSRELEQQLAQEYNSLTQDARIKDVLRCIKPREIAACVAKILSKENMINMYTPIEYDIIIKEENVVFVPNSEFQEELRRYNAASNKNQLLYPPDYLTKAVYRAVICDVLAQHLKKLNAAYEKAQKMFPHIIIKSPLGASLPTYLLLDFKYQVEAISKYFQESPFDISKKVANQ